MSKANPLFHFVNVDTPNQGAWCLAVALIARADLSKPSSYTIRIDEVFDMRQNKWRPRFITEMILGAANFSFIAYESWNVDGSSAGLLNASSFEVIHLFSALHYSLDYPGAVEAAFHSKALFFLRKLQTSIYQLFKQNGLTPVNLLEYMRISNPSAKLKMTVVPHYAGSMEETLFCLNGIPKSYLSQFMEKHKNIEG